MVSCRVCKTGFEPGSYRDELCPGCGALVPVSVRLCPCCTLPFEQREVDGLVIDECSRCGGVFLDHQTQRRVLANDVTANAVVAALSHSAKEVAVASGRPALACPACTEPMQRKLADSGAGVVFDVCSTHGTFFDGAELPALVAFQRVVEERRASVRTRDVPYTSNERSPWDITPNHFLVIVLVLASGLFVLAAMAGHGGHH